MGAAARWPSFPKTTGAPFSRRAGEGERWRGGGVSANGRIENTVSANVHVARLDVDVPRQGRGRGGTNADFGKASCRGTGAPCPSRKGAGHSAHFGYYTACVAIEQWILGRGEHVAVAR